jgi:thioredoxin reductase (NADPH)
MEPDKDLIIIGGGAAGLTAAQYGARANLRTLLLDELAAGGQCLVIDRLENYPGFPEPLTGFEFAERMEQQARSFGAEIRNSSAQKLTRKNGFFEVETTDGVLTAYTVLLATGAKHRKLMVTGESELAGKGVSYCATCDGPFFRGKRILVVGGGDAACDEATFLSKLTDSVIMVHRRDRFRAQKALANRVLGNPNIQVRWNTVVRRIVGNGKVERVELQRTDSGESYEEAVDALFVFIGSIPQTGLVPDLPKDSGGFVTTDERMQTSVPGLLAAGDVRATPFRQLVVVAGEGAIAAHAASQYIDELKGEAYA